MTSLPRPLPAYQPSPPDPGRSQQLRRQHARNQKRADKYRQAVVEAGPPLKDPQAAVDCRCSCHPKPPSFDLHEGGVDCPCQRTPEEQQQRRQDALAQLMNLTAPLADIEKERQEALTAAAAKLGVEMTRAGGAAPFVIEGTCDGTRFYLRERHGQYTITIPAEDDRLDADPADHSIDRLVIGEGSDRHLYDRDNPGRPLEVAAAAVRLFHLQRDCSHPERKPGGFCPNCGQAAPGHPAVV